MHTQVTVNDLKQKVDLVLGRQNCELQLKNVRLINVFTGQIIRGADIFIHNGKIVDAGLKCQAKANEFFEKLDINIRTHLRCLIWRAWKKPKTRERELRKRGLDEYNAWKSANKGKGPWWNAQALHMRIYIPNALFKRMRLYSLRLQRNA